MSPATPIREIKIVGDTDELNRAAADEFARCAQLSISARGRFCVALAGGSTPRGVYSLLADDQRNSDKPLSWEKIFVFFGDERHVPPDDPESNYRMAKESLLSKVPIPSENVFRVAAELDAGTAAAQYEEKLRAFFQTGPNEWPQFDLIMLGIGPDGHTASLFPESAALNENSRMVVANWVEKFKTYRITFTFPVLNHAAEIIFLVSGENKAEILKHVLQGPQTDAYPCQRVQPVNGRLLWLVDKAAAKLL
jgi:6-phosphogluconolactonase